jgi:predicted nucleic acid-binding protein
LIVVDASALAGALVESSPAAARAAQRLDDDRDQHAPALIDLEIVSMVRRWLRRGELVESRAEQALDDLAAHPLQRYTHVALLPRMWELRHNLTPYDAAYVALAELLGAILLTADSRLANAPGPRCTIELLG